MATSMMAPDYTHWHGTYILAQNWYTKFVPELEELIAEGKKAGGEKAKAADALQKKLDEILSNSDHKWYLGQK
jgi:hypothetical protein